MLWKDSATSFSFTLCIYLSFTAVQWFIPQDTVDQQLFEETQFFVIHILKYILEENTQLDVVLSQNLKWIISCT